MAGVQNPQIAAYIVKWLLKRREQDVSWQAIADEVKAKTGKRLSKQHLIGMASVPPRIGAGGKTIDVFASFFFNGSLDALRDASADLWRQSPELRARFGEDPEPEPRQKYVPEHLEDDEQTRRTIEYAVEVEGLSQEAVDRVLSRVPGGAGGERMPPGLLLDQIRAADNAIKFERRVGKDEARRLRGETEVTDELD